jgi:proteasome accessory factor C
MTRVSAGTRLRRVLAMVPWLVSRPEGAPIDEVCRRFGVNREQLLADLGVLWMVGVYPYSPAELIEVSLDDDRVAVRLADWFRQPLRLTPDQALALVATGQSLSSAQGAEPDGPLARGLEKIAAVLGVDTDAVEVALGDADAGMIEALQGAADEGRRVEIDYYSYGRDERTVRPVDPLRVFADQGQWYLQAYCHQSDDERIFRIDRIATLTVLDQAAASDATKDAAGTVPVFPDDPDLPRVVLELDPPARWVVEQYPMETVGETAEGRLRVTIAVSAPAWLERLLLRLGPDGRVVDGPSDLRAAGRRAARRVLERYHEA